MALIELTSNLSVKAGQTNTTENGTFRVRQGNNTERTTEFTDEQVREQHKKFKPDEDQLITHKIGDGYKGTNQDAGFVRGGFILNTDRQIEDTKRLTKFLSTPKGFLFKTKQSILQKGNARPETREYNRTSIIRNVNSTTAILNGDVSNAGETRHRDRGTYEQVYPERFFTTVPPDQKLTNPITREPVDNIGQEGNVTYQSSYQPELNPTVREYSRDAEGNPITKEYKQTALTNEYSSGQNSYEERANFFNVGGEENVSTGLAPKESWEGSQDRKQGIKNAVAYLSPGDNAFKPGGYKGRGFGDNNTKPKSLQVLYGGEFGKLDMIPKTNQKGNRADLEKKSSNDFIKFRIRDAVNGKWIIFPALISGITDNSQANYSKIQYIGRPDSVHVYQNFNRSVSFNLKVLATNENELGIVWQKVSALKGLTQPSFKPFFYESERVVGTGEKFTRPTAPYVYLTIGDMFKNTPGYFESVNVTIPEASSWEIVEGAQFPHMCDISCTFQYIGRELPATTSINYDGLRPGIRGQNSVIRNVIPTGEFT